ncbi:MAG TPA: tetratricopeptide repeat protein, partial [Candidatus Kapabacteria bacterium]|nr:tetratricopeptide repeat protein [Candidatus Kapabacteria bacterium]
IFFFSKRLENCKNSTRIGKTLFYIGTSYLSLEKPDTAMIFIKKAIEEEPNDILSYVYQGDVYSKLGQNDSSKISFKLAIEKGAADTSAQGRNFVNQAYAKLCGIVFDEKNYKELLKISTEWSQFDPNYSFAFLYLGIANQGLEDKDAACRNYRKVIQLDPKNKPAQEMVKKLGC